MKLINLVFILLLLFNVSIQAEKEEKSFSDKANDYFEKGKFSLAEIFYVKVLKDHPDDYKANFNLGKI